ncbi:MAG: sortase [bacterium]|nr:sortase [bacterium]
MSQVTIASILTVLWEELTRNAKLVIFLSLFAIIVILTLMFRPFEGGVVAGFGTVPSWERGYIAEMGIEVPLSTRRPVPVSPGSLTISKLGVQAPMHFVQSVLPDDFGEPMKKGVAWFPSSIPGERGRVVVLGHSAPPGWMGLNPYLNIFSKIHTLEEGDIITLDVEGVTYTYKVKGAVVIMEKGEPLPPFIGTKGELVLISCWPPGIDYKRMVIFAEQI